MPPKPSKPQIESIHADIEPIHYWGSDDDDNVCQVKTRRRNKQTEPRSRYNTGIIYKMHSDTTRVNVLYAFFVEKKTLEEIKNKFDVKYNTVRNFINSFRTESGM